MADKTTNVWRSTAIWWENLKRSLDVTAYVKAGISSRVYFILGKFNIRKKQHHQQKQQEKQEQNKTKQENIWTFSQFWVTDRKVEFTAKGLAVV